MNYSTLFPELLKQVPSIKEQDMCYHYQKQNNDNTNVNIFWPSGKKMLLWFLKYNKQMYGIVMEYDSKRKNIQRCYFHYLCFKPELTNGCGTMIWCCKSKNELCLQKVIYKMGKKYEKHKLDDHMYELKHMLENYIQPLSRGYFLQLKLPIMTTDKNLLLQASCVPYGVHSIMKSSHYQIFLKEYCATFKVNPYNIKRNIYELYSTKNDEFLFYDNAFVNDVKTSIWLKDLFSKKKVSYLDIEYSDDEDYLEEIHKPKTLVCIYIPSVKKWKPYKLSSFSVDLYSKIKFIENKKYNVYL